MTVEKILFQNIKTTNYIPTLLGGLFAIATIMFVVFSFISNTVTKRTAGFSLIYLKRYKIWFLFLPIYFATIISILAASVPSLNNYCFLNFAMILDIVLITIQTYFILQPLYNPQKCKSAIIKLRIRSFKKKIKKSKTLSNAKRLLEEEEKNLFNLITKDSKSSENGETKFLLFEDKQLIFTSYVNIIQTTFKKMSDDISIKFIEIGLNIFDDEGFRVLEHCCFNEKIFLDVLLNKNEDKFNISYYKKSFDLIHTMYIAYQDGEALENTYDSSQWRKFIDQTFQHSEAVTFLWDYIFNIEQWSYKDSEFVLKIFQILSCINIDASYFKGSENNCERARNFLKSFKETKEIQPIKDELDERFNLILKIKTEIH